MTTGCGARSAKKRKGKAPGPPVHDDLVSRVFTAEMPDRLWFSDITEHPTLEGKLYLCDVKVACSRRSVGYSISPRMTARIAVDAITSAAQRRDQVAGCIVHTDHGSQFRSRTAQRALQRHGLVGSMGRVGAAGDDAALESFFSLLQRTSSTTEPGPHETNSGSRSSPGPDAPTTADADNTASAD